jgi:hypothetical protein
MSIAPVNDCQTNGEQCLRLAKGARDPAIREAGLQLAQTWFRLARLRADQSVERAERTTEPSQVCWTYASWD